MNERSGDKPYSEACERNKHAILDVLRREFADVTKVLEIGSGTGQHAAYFAAQLPHLSWQTSDVRELHAGIRVWLDASCAPNALPPLALDVVRDAWPAGPYDAVFSANTAHIMSWPEVLATLDGVRTVLQVGGIFCLYGPFAYDGRHTSTSNAEFDAVLRARDPNSGVRDASALRSEAGARSLRLVEDYSMPANNRTLVFRRERTAS